MLIRYIKNLNQFCLRRIDKHNEVQYWTFAIYGLINTIIPYFLWEYNLQDLLTIILHIIASSLCFMLIFVDDWIPSFKRYYPVCWYFILFYTLPFLSTYMLFNNGLSTGWIINSILALFLLSFLVDWLDFLVLLGCGIIIGWFVCWSSHDAIEIKDWHKFNYIFLLYMYLSSIIIGGVFIRNKAFYNLEKEEYLKLLSGAIAHELRTPLLSIALGVTAIKEQSQMILDVDCPEHNIKFPDTMANHHKLEILNKLLNNVCQTIKESSSIIDMFLIKLKADLSDEELSKCSMQGCIVKALKDYPLTDYERGLIVWQEIPNFYFKGNEMLMVHVLLNLLKNSLYYVKAANKGKIYISLASKNDSNILRFKDTGKGISKNIIGNIFRKFYSKTQHGTGIGLSFCKLVMDIFGGLIECKSQEGKFTEFTLHFPLLKDNN